MTEADPPAIDFAGLGLAPGLLEALDAVGYETPSPIQAEIIPHMLAGSDVIGQAQTGTGKTAAFALPILSRMDLKQRRPQALVLAPTRELAIQVAEAFQRYAAKLPGFHVVPIYGGQAYETQLKQLKRGVHVVVGTPGRLLDHMKRGTLDLSHLRCLVLDEADEMLRMGFIDDVEWILGQTPPGRQVALFSATMPQAIRRIAQKHLSEPQEITVRHSAASAPDIRQRVWLVAGMHKLDALTRILEAEPFDGVLIFTRTKLATVELADKLEARGHAATAINGDMDQRQRERTVEQFKRGKLDILVATDVVARGIDVDRVSHVINYDIPHDTEAYVHRIGRTGRAGRSGDAILFVAPREKRMLYAIERATGQRIPPLELPSVERVNDQRIARFMQRVSDTLAGADLTLFTQLIEQYEREHDVPATQVAAALAHLLQGDKPLLLEAPRARGKDRRPAEDSRPPRPPRDKPAAASPARAKVAKVAKPAEASEPPARRPKPAPREAAPDMETFRVEVGREHGAEAGNIVGAIANEAGLDSQYIGKIDIQADHSLIELPAGMPRDIFRDLKKTWVAGRQLQISRLGEAPGQPAAPAKNKTKRSKPATGKGPKPGRKPPGKKRKS